MISLTRTQVKAMLDIISKDDSRPAIENAKVIQRKDKTYLTGTDGYAMFLLEVDSDYASMVGKGIHRSEIERWYKLATGKDRLTEEVLNDMHYNDETFPDINDGI